MATVVRKKRMTQTIRLYRYLPATAAVKTIEKRMLKVSRLTELNDPFECMPGVRNFVPKDRPHIQACLDQFLAILNDSFGITCFSERLREPVLWSHYADAHRGICLEFDQDLDDALFEVDYTSERCVIDLDRIGVNASDSELREIVRGLTRKKSPSWSYEKERRTISDLAKCTVSEGMYLNPIPPDYLKRVIVGVNCTIGVPYLQRALACNGFADVEVRKATRNMATFEIDCEPSPYDRPAAGPAFGES
jgi:hypothetical protein